MFLYNSFKTFDFQFGAEMFLQRTSDGWMNDGALDLIIISKCCVAVITQSKQFIACTRMMKRN